MIYSAAMGAWCVPAEHWWAFGGIKSLAQGTRERGSAMNSGVLSWQQTTASKVWR